MPFFIHSFVCQRSLASEPLVAAFREFGFNEVEADGRTAFAVVAE